MSQQKPEFYQAFPLARKIRRYEGDNETSVEQGVKACKELADFLKLPSADFDFTKEGGRSRLFDAYTAYIHKAVTYEEIMASQGEALVCFAGDTDCLVGIFDNLGNTTNKDSTSEVGDVGALIVAQLMKADRVYQESLAYQYSCETERAMGAGLDKASLKTWTTIYKQFKKNIRHYRVTQISEAVYAHRGIQQAALALIQKDIDTQGPATTYGIDFTRRLAGIKERVEKSRAA